MNSGVLTGLAVGFAVCWVLLVLCIRRSYHHRMLDERLNAPLLAGCVTFTRAASKTCMAVS